jgi:hypothetical protein
MTTKEIAQAVGKNPDTIQVWIKKILQPSISVGQPTKSVDGRLVNSIREKAGSRDSRHPADYTLEETLAIIEAGMGPDAAGVFRANSAAPRREPRPVTRAYLRELTAAYDKSLINRDDWRSLAGLPLMPVPAGEQLTLPLLEARTAGLEFYQGLAEAGGLSKSDRDDVADTYRRGQV